MALTGHATSMKTDLLLFFLMRPSGQVSRVPLSEQLPLVAPTILTTPMGTRSEARAIGQLQVVLARCAVRGFGAVTLGARVGTGLAGHSRTGVAHLAGALECICRRGAGCHWVARSHRAGVGGGVAVVAGVLVVTGADPVPFQAVVAGAVSTADRLISGAGAAFHAEVAVVAERDRAFAF